MMTLSKISIAITGIILATGIANIIGVLNSEYADIIINIGLAKDM